MRELIVPKLNNNDESYVLLDWLFQDGDEVPAGADVAVIETSKAAQDLVCDDGGVLQRVVPEKSDCQPGQAIAWLFADDDERQLHLASMTTGPGLTGSGLTGSGAPDPAVPGGEELVVTAAAQELIDEYGIATERIRNLGKTIIKRVDVERLIGAGTTASGKTVALSRRQRAVADVVTESSRTVPTAFTVIKVDADAALAYATRFTERTTTTIGLPELLVRAIADARAEFPLMFGRLVDPATVEVATASHVGVTVDVGKGLSIPVVRDADSRSLTDIADTLMDLRIRSLRDNFQESQLTGGVITLSLSNDEGVVFAQPIVFPGQSCMISLGGISHEVALDATTGGVRARRVTHIGLAYDHRIVNGRDAVAFLTRLRTVLESAEGLAALDRAS